MYLPLEVAKNYMLPKEPSKNQFAALFKIL